MHRAKWLQIFTMVAFAVFSCCSCTSLFSTVKLRPGQRSKPAETKLDPQERRRVSIDGNQEDADQSEPEIQDSWNKPGYRLGDSAGGEGSWDGSALQERGEVAVQRLREHNEHLRTENKHLLKDLKSAEQLNAELSERESAWKDGMLQLETLEATWAEGVKKLKEDRDGQERKMRAEAKRVRKSMDDIISSLKGDKQKLKAKLKAAEDRVTELLSREQNMLDEQQDIKGTISSQGVEISALGRLERDTIAALHDLISRQVQDTSAQTLSAAAAYSSARESMQGGTTANQVLLRELAEREKRLRSDAEASEKRLLDLEESLQRLLQQRDEALQPFPASATSPAALRVKTDVDMAELTKKLQVLEGTVVDMDKRLLHSSAQIEALEEELRQARATVASREESCRRLEQLLEAKEDEVSSLKLQLRAAAEEGERRVAETAAGFKEEIGGLEGKVKALEEDLQGKVATMHTLETTMAERERKNAQTIAQLEAERTVLVEAASKGNMRMEELKEELRNAANEIDAEELSRKMGNVVSSVTEIESLLQQKNHEVEGARSSVGALMEEKQVLETEKAEAEALLRQLQSAPLKEGWLRERMEHASPSQQAWFARALTLRQSEGDVEEEQLVALRGEREALQTKVSELEGAVSDMQTKRQKQEEVSVRDRERAEREIADQKDRLATLRSEKASLEERLQSLQEQYAQGARLGVAAGEEGRLGGEGEVARLEVLGLQSQNDAMRAELDRKQEELTRTLKRAEEERQERERKDLHHAAMEQRMQEWRAMLAARANELETALDSLRFQTQEAHAFRDAADGEVAAVEAKAREEAKKKEAEIGLLQAERTSLHAELAELREQVTKERKAYGEMMKRVGTENEDLQFQLRTRREQAAALEEKLRGLVEEGAAIRVELEARRQEHVAMDGRERQLAAQLRTALQQQHLDQGRIEELLAASEELSEEKSRIEQRNSEVHRQLALKVAEIEVTSDMLKADTDQATSRLHEAEAKLLRMEVNGVPAPGLKFHVKNLNGPASAPSAAAAPRSAADLNRHGDKKARDATTASGLGKLAPRSSWRESLAGPST